MAAEKFFHQFSSSEPVIYAYRSKKDSSYVFIGYTTIKPIDGFKSAYEGNCNDFENILVVDAMRSDGSCVTDVSINNYFENKYNRRNDGCYNITKDQLSNEIKYLLKNKKCSFVKESYSMRPEQEEAVEMTMRYFTKVKAEDPNKTAHFLWNCKMRFGKTYTAYQLVKRMNWKKVLVLTFKPAVESAWEDDLLQNPEFKGWAFCTCKDTTEPPLYSQDMPFVCFGSFQDLMGKNTVGGIKAKNEWIHLTNWDCVILDEYHYGAWRDGAKELFESESSDTDIKNLDLFDEDLMPITTNYYLYLSGTPFRAISTGEFIEQQIYNWTYTDEQKSKKSWDDNKGYNPYISLPRIVMLTYKLPDEIRTIAEDEFNNFDLNEFFSTNGSAENAQFEYKESVQQWLDFICGKYKGGIYDDIKNYNGQKNSMPFSNQLLQSNLNHTFWFLPNVDSCYAMKNILSEPQNSFFNDYTIVVAAGAKAGMGVDAVIPVKDAMSNPTPLKSKSITLSCGKLTTGVTVRPWSGIFILRNLNSPETYFQASFRVQSPWTIKNSDFVNQNDIEILKKECYVFDFSPSRALKQIADYSCRLSIDEDSPESKVTEFIKYFPILNYEDGKMFQLHSEAILDVSLSGTTANLLARRWESARLVNVDDDTLRRLLNNPQALAALQKIEGFRNLNSDLEDIINKSKSIKSKKKEGTKKTKQDTEEEKEYKTLRKELQEKLIRFAARIPIFMYLTDYREKCLKDIIQKIEPALFKKVTGLEVEDFDLLLSIGVFNSQLMNDAIYKFKQYEDSSLDYSGINKHNETEIGGFDTVISKEEYSMM